MALSKATLDLENLVTCAICLENFTERDPRTLPCLHTFCVDCLQQTYLAKVARKPSMKRFITCPTCNEKSKLPDSSVYKLRHYFMARQVTDVVNDLSRAQCQDEDDAVYWCTRCRKKRNPTSYCFDCIQPMCVACLANHNMKSANKLHVSVAVKRSNISSLICETHKEFVEDYCITCMCIVCSTCHTSTHKGHEFRSFSLKEDPSSTEIQQHIDSLINENGTFRSKVFQLKEEFDAYLKDTATEIDNLKNEIFQHITAEVKKIQNEIKAHDPLMKSKLNALEIFSDGHRDELLSLKEEVIRITSPLRDIPKLYVSDLQQLVEVQRKKIPKLSSDLPEIKILQFIPEIVDIKALSIGRMQVQSDAKILPTPPVSATLSCDENVTERHEWSRVWKKTISSSYQSKNSVDFLPNGDIITAHGDDLFVYDRDGKAKDIPFPSKGIKAIQQVVIHRPSSLAALLFGSDAQSVKLFSLDSSKRKNITMKVSSATSIAFAHDGQLLVGGYNKLTKYSWKNRKLWEIDIEHPCRYMKVTNDGKIVVSNQTKKGFLDHGSLYVYNAEGSLLYTIPEHDSQLSKILESLIPVLFKPCGVCVDRNDNIFVCDPKGVNDVVMFNSKGRHIRNFDISEVLDSLRGKHQPENIAVFEDTMAVTTGREIHIYARKRVSRDWLCNALLFMTLVILTSLVVFRIIHYMSGEGMHIDPKISLCQQHSASFLVDGQVQHMCHIC